MAVTAIARLAQLRSIIGVLELAQQKTHADTASIQHNHHLVELLASGGILGDAPATGGSAWAPVADAVIQLLELLERLACKAEPHMRPLAATLLGAAATAMPLHALLPRCTAWVGALLEAAKRDKREGDGVLHAAACEALAKIFTRLGECLDVPGVRKEGSGLAGRCFQSLILPAITPSTTAANLSLQQQLSALHALLAILAVLPASLRQHAPALESALLKLLAVPGTGAAGAAALMGTASDPVSAGTRLAAARALALLPRVAGDEAAWSACQRRLLLVIHSVLDGCLMGLGEGPSAARARELLTGSGTAANANGGAPYGSSVMQPAAPGSAKPGLQPSILASSTATASAAAPAPATAGTAKADGGWTAVLLPGGAAATAMLHGGHAGQRSLGPLLDLLVVLLEAYEALLCASYPVPVPLAAHAAILTAQRLIKLDVATLLAGGRTPPSAHMATELYCALPGLRLAGYRMLQLICTACTASALLPFQALVSRMLGASIRTAASGGGMTLSAVPPAERAALYRSTSILLRKCGLSAGRALSTDALGVLGVELYGVVLQHAALNVPGRAAAMGRSGASSGNELLGSPAKKQKTGKGGLDLPSQDLASAAALAPPGHGPAEVAAQAEALAMMQALLEVSGPCMPSETRTRADALAAHMAQCCMEGAVQCAREVGAAAGRAAAAGELRRLRTASYRTLCASVCAPGAGRPPFLANALRLFQAGVSDPAADQELQAVCSTALLSLEGLLRPRSTPWSLPGSTSNTYSTPDLPVLPRPRMWSVLDPSTNAPVVIAAQTAPAAAAAAAPTANRLQPQAAAAGPTAAAAPASGTGKAQTPAAAAASSVQAPASAAACEKVTAAAAAAAAVGKKGAAVAAAKTDAPSPATAAAVTAAVGPSQLQPTAAAVSPATAAKAAAAAPPTVAAAVAAPLPAAFAGGDSSSDSEGSLPDIDSGGEEGDGQEASSSGSD